MQWKIDQDCSSPGVQAAQWDELRGEGCFKVRNTSIIWQRVCPVREERGAMALKSLSVRGGKDPSLALKRRRALPSLRRGRRWEELAQKKMVRGRVHREHETGEIVAFISLLPLQ